MRRAVVAVAGVVALGAPARADRETVTTVSVIVDETAQGRSFSDAGDHDPDWRGGARLMLTFEDASLPIPAPGDIASDLRLVPELHAGFLADRVHAEGEIGAGLRGELHLASNRRAGPMRTVLYAAARADVIGKHQDGAPELAIGTYLLGWHHRRFGWELAVMFRPTPSDGAARRDQLDALLSFYVGWGR